MCNKLLPSNWSQYGFDGSTMKHLRFKILVVPMTLDTRFWFISDGDNLRQFSGPIGWNANFKLSIREIISSTPLQSSEHGPFGGILFIFSCSTTNGLHYGAASKEMFVSKIQGLEPSFPHANQGVSEAIL